MVRPHLCVSRRGTTWNDMRFTVGAARDCFLQMCMSQVTLGTALSAGKNATAYIGFLEDRRRYDFHAHKTGNDYSFIGDYGDITRPVPESKDKTLPEKANARRGMQFAKVHKEVATLIAEGATERDIGDYTVLSF